MFWMAVESATRASGALDEAVAWEALRWALHAQGFSVVEFRFVDCENTRALWSKPGLRWNMLGMRKATMSLQ